MLFDTVNSINITFCSFSFPVSFRILCLLVARRPHTVQQPLRFHRQEIVYGLMNKAIYLILTSLIITWRHYV
jgi:hypothetical protein